AAHGASWSPLPADLLQRHDTETERVTIVVDDLGQLSCKSGDLFIIEFDVHTSQIVRFTNRYETWQWTSFQTSPQINSTSTLNSALLRKWLSVLWTPRTSRLPT